MIKQNTNSKKGFTIIEVVLVLAIAGLIFLMVFVALPALQRSQRDTQRRSDLSRVDTALAQYQANHQNSRTGLPNAGNFETAEEELTCGNNVACKFIQDYMNSTNSTTNTFQDPDGNYYNMSIISAEGNNGHGNVKYDNAAKNFYYDANEMDHIVYVLTSGKCANDTVEKGAPRDYAVLYRLEGSGTACIDNQ